MWMQPLKNQQIDWRGLPQRHRLISRGADCRTRKHGTPKEIVELDSGILQACGVPSPLSFISLVHLERPRLRSSCIHLYNCS